MAVKNLLIGSGLLCFGIIFIVLGALTPTIVDSSLKTQAENAAVLKSSNRHTYWGELPGQLDQIIFQTFNFYHIENPTQVLWEGAVPVLTEKNGYVYQEFDTFEDLDYGHDQVSFFNYKRLVKNKNCIWSNFTSPNDKITTVNPGAFAVWSKLKHLSREKLALYTLFGLYKYFTKELGKKLFAYSMYPSFDNLTKAEELIFNPAGIDEVQGELIYTDPYLGIGDVVTLEIWVQALIDNVENNEFIMPANLTGALYTISNTFSLSPSTINSIFTGQLLNIYNAAITEIYNAYSLGSFNCTDRLEQCIGALQWSSSIITTNPPKIPAFGPSITSLNPFITGYPEISYYLNATTIGNKYPGVEFKITDFFTLFQVSENDWPVYAKSSLLDVGRITKFFSMGYSGNFSQIAEEFSLVDENHGKVLWDYINALVDETALQGRSDPLVYNHLNRGISSEYGIGKAGSSTMQGILSAFSTEMPLVLTSVYGYLTAEYKLNLTCEILLNDILPEAEYICYIEELAWQNNTLGFQLWVATHWYGLNSTYANTFMNLSGLSYPQMEILFSPQGELIGNLSLFDSELMQYYSCQNAGNRCNGRFLGEMQWGQGYISTNLPEIFSLFDIKNSTSLSNIPELNFGLDFPAEYYYFAVKNKTGPLNYTEILRLFGENGLFHAVVMQKYFIDMFELNFTDVQTEFGIEHPGLFAMYLRNMINSYYFGGIFASKSVNELLFTNVDPLIASMISQNPLEGGDPALSIELARFGRNQTRAQWEYLPDSMKSVLNSGSSSKSQTRKYKKYLGSNYSNFLEQVYLGEGQSGPTIITANTNPWSSQVPLKGTDGLFFQPSLSTNDHLSYYYEPGCISLDLYYNKTVTRRELECYRYMMSAKQFENATQNAAQSTYFQFGPSGLLNTTSIYSIPFFLSSPYFLNADPVLNNLVQYTTLQFDAPERYHSYYDLEKYTGTPIYQVQQFQMNAELFQDAMFPKLGSANLFATGYNTFLPVFYVQRTSSMTRGTVNEHLSYIINAGKASDTMKLIGIMLGVIFIIAVGMLALKLQISKQRLRKNQILGVSKQPILLA